MLHRLTFSKETTTVRFFKFLKSCVVYRGMTCSLLFCLWFCLHRFTRPFWGCKLLLFHLRACLFLSPLRKHLLVSSIYLFVRHDPSRYNFLQHDSKKKLSLLREKFPALDKQIHEFIFSLVSTFLTVKSRG